MKAEDTLNKAASLVGGDRANTHGDKEANHSNIANLWAAYLRNKPLDDECLTPHDVAMMMVLLKVARTQAGSHNPDDYVDMAGYAGIAGGLAKENRYVSSTNSVIT
tara:strand:- start:145 stop:462 length:318 start_codon:yes stop_codon:yes gene_type:complete